MRICDDTLESAIGSEKPGKLGLIRTMVDNSGFPSGNGTVPSAYSLTFVMLYLS